MLPWEKKKLDDDLWWYARQQGLRDGAGGTQSNPGIRFWPGYETGYREGLAQRCLPHTGDAKPPKQPWEI